MPRISAPGQSSNRQRPFLVIPAPALAIGYVGVVASPAQIQSGPGVVRDVLWWMDVTLLCDCTSNPCWQRPDVRCLSKRSAPA